MPARAQYAAAADAALPADGSAAARAPSSFALLTAAESPLALNDPVGFIPSSLTNTWRSPSFAATRGSGRSGVIPSPRVTMLPGSSTGINSRYRHIVGARPAMISRDTPDLARSRSYRGYSTLPHLAHTVWSSSALYVAPQAVHSR